MEDICEQGRGKVEEEDVLLALRLLRPIVNLLLRALVVVLQSIQDKVDDSVFDENWGELRFYRHLLHNSNAESGVDRVSHWVGGLGALNAKLNHNIDQRDQNFLSVGHKVFHSFERARYHTDQTENSVLHCRLVYAQ